MSYTTYIGVNHSWSQGLLSRAATRRWKFRLSGLAHWRAEDCAALHWT